MFSKPLSGLPLWSQPCQSLPPSGSFHTLLPPPRRLFPWLFLWPLLKRHFLREVFPDYPNRTLLIILNPLYLVSCIALTTIAISLCLLSVFPSKPVLSNGVTTGGYLNSSLRKSNKTKHSIPQFSRPRFKCSLATCGLWLLYIIMHISQKCYEYKKECTRRMLQGVPLQGVAYLHRSRTH